MVTPNTYLKGAGAYYQDTANSATRILCYDGTVDALQIGPDTMAATINDFTKCLRVSDVFVQFYSAPNTPSGRAAVPNQYTLGAIIDDVRTGDAIKGFWFYGTVFTTANRCYASRATAGTGGGTDIWWGYHVDGSVVVPSVAGGNASVYLNYCSASCGLIPLQTGNSSGFYIDFKFSDTFLNHTESVNCNVGINVQGDGSTSATTTNVDLQINHATNDAFKSYGMFFNNVNKFGSAAVHGGYVGASAGALAGVRIQNCPGSVSLHGGQAVMINAPTATGVSIESSAQANVLFTQILECGTVAVDLNNAVNCKVFPVVKNHTTTLASAVVRCLNASNRNEIRPSLTGKSGAAALGIQLVSTGSAYNEINPTGIEPAALAGGAWKAYVMGKNTVQAEWVIEREAANEKARETRERNRSTALTAEKIYIDRERVRTEFLVTTQKEVINETANLATCKLDPGDIRVLNDAANRIREDRPAAANPDNALPVTR